MNLTLLFEEMQGKFAFIFLFSVVIEWLVLVINHKINSNKGGLVNLLSYFVELLPYFVLDVFFLV